MSRLGPGDVEETWLGGMKGVMVGGLVGGLVRGMVRSGVGGMVWSGMGRLEVWYGRGYATVRSMVWSGVWSGVWYGQGYGLYNTKGGSRGSPPCLHEMLNILLQYR